MKNVSKRSYGPTTDQALKMWVKLARAFSVFKNCTTEYIRTYGFTEPQFAVLECLGHLGSMPIGEISTRMMVSPGNITVIVDNLAKQGLIRRRRDPRDRRVIYVELTPQGQARFEEIFPKHAEQVAHLASALTSEEQLQLGQLLQKLGKTLQQKRQEGIDSAEGGCGFPLPEDVA